MKKLLLLFVGAVLTVAAGAQGTKVYENVMYSAMSPNGKYAAGSNMYTDGVDIINLETGETLSFVPEDETTYYTVGMGANSISNDGIVLISTTYNGTASYVENGEIKQLPLPEGIEAAFCNAITPDGSRIAGTIGYSMDLNATDVMQRPVVWNRQADGTYAAPIELPYPKADFTGRLPQYVLVDGISEDGNTLACQVVDFSGMLPQPMTMTLASEGNWSYKTYGEELINPAGIELPPYPGEEPKAENFMTPEELEAYQKALEEVANLVEPDPLDFMTEEEKAAYLAALEAEGYAWPGSFMTEEELERYDAAMTEYYAKLYLSAQDFMSEASLAAYVQACEEWEPLYAAYNEAFDELMMTAATFEMNSLVMSPNGKYYASAAAFSEIVQGETEFDVDVMEQTRTIIFDCETGASVQKIAKGYDTAAPTYIDNQGRLLACKNASFFDLNAMAFVSPSLDAELVPLHEFVKATDPATYDWMEKNMHHKVTQSYWDDELEEEVEMEVDVWATGTPCCDANMTHIMAWQMNTWDYSDEAAPLYTYALPVNLNASAVESVNGSDAKLAVKMNANGDVVLNGEASEVAVYDMSGRMVFSTKKPGAVVKTGLGRGSYIVKAAGQKGSATQKVLR